MIDLPRSPDGPADLPVRLHRDTAEVLTELAEQAGVPRPNFVRRLVADYGLLAVADLVRPGRITATEVPHAPAGESPAVSELPGGVSGASPGKTRRGRL